MIVGIDSVSNEVIQPLISMDTGSKANLKLFLIKDCIVIEEEVQTKGP